MKIYTMVNQKPRISRSVHLGICLSLHLAKRAWSLRLSSHLAGKQNEFNIDDSNLRVVNRSHAVSSQWMKNPLIAQLIMDTQLKTQWKQSLLGDLLISGAMLVAIWVPGCLVGKWPTCSNLKGFDHLASHSRRHFVHRIWSPRYENSMNSHVLAIYQHGLKGAK